MDAGLRLDLSQKLIMTPQLRQAIAILQLTSLELATTIEQEVLDNPVLELEDKTDTPAENDADAIINTYVDYADYLGDANESTADAGWQQDKPALQIADNNMSLQEALERQLNVVAVDRAVKRVGTYLIGCIDANGYLRCSVTAAATELGENEDFVSEVLALIQTFDPAGVGARDLKECLLIQLCQRSINDKIVETVITCYLDHVAAGRFKEIAAEMGCRPIDVQMAVDFIRTLNPKPGQCFGGASSPYIVPDVTIEAVNGKYIVHINDTFIPRLIINPYYRRFTAEADQSTKKYIAARINAAMSLIKSIEQRRRTLYKVTEAIVDLQQEFFDHGPSYIRPMVMAKVAERVGIHESTVSRAIANKYAATPHGLFRLRDFFPAAVRGTEGEDVAAATVKREIQALVAAEDPAKPFSDQAIAGILEQKDIIVARRTVAKYREELGIASSSKRKRY